jgi:hypothetical protein
MEQWNIWLEKNTLLHVQRWPKLNGLIDWIEKVSKRISTVSGKGVIAASKLLDQILFQYFTVVVVHWQNCLTILGMKLCRKTRNIKE